MNIKQKYNQPLWDDHAWSQLPQLTGNENCDLCVVGLGGGGLTAIKTAQALGLQCIGIDAEDVGAGAAGRNGGLLLAGLPDFYHNEVKKMGRAQAKSMYLETMYELDCFFKEFPKSTKRVGSLRIASDSDELKDVREQYEAMKLDDLPVEWYKGKHGEGIFMPTDG